MAMATEKDKFLFKRRQTILDNKRQDLCLSLDLSEALLDQLCAHTVISTTQKQAITATHTSYDRNSAFIEIIKRIDLEKYRICLRALLDNNKAGIAKIMGAVELGEMEGEVEETPDSTNDEGPMTKVIDREQFPFKRQRSILDGNRYDLCLSLDLPDYLLDQMVTNQVITSVHKQAIMAGRTPYEKNGNFLDIIGRIDVDKYKRCIHVLMENNRTELAQIMGSGELGEFEEDEERNGSMNEMDAQAASLLSSMSSAKNVAHMLKLLGNTELHRINEWEIIKVLLQWIIKNKPKFVSDVEELLSAVYMEWVNPKHLDGMMEVYRDFRHKDVLQRKVKEAMSWQRAAGHDVSSVDKHLYPRPRVGRPLVGVIGGVDRPINQYEYNDVYHLSGSRNYNIRVADLPDHRCYAAVVTSGATYVIGGWNGRPTATCFKVDVSTGVVKELPQMKFPRARHTACALDDQIVVIAGLGNDDRLTSVEVFSTKEHRWQEAAHFPYTVASHSSCTLADTVYATGGLSERETKKDIHSFVKGVWKHVAEMLEARSGHAMAGINGLLLIVGGRNTMSAELYDIATGQGSYVTAPPDIVGGITNAVMLDSKVIMLAPESKVLLTWDIQLQEWTKQEIKLSRTYRTTHIALVTTDDEPYLLVTAGEDFGDTLSTAHVFTFGGELVNEDFALPQLPNGRQDAAVVIMNDVVYVIGGMDANNTIELTCYKAEMNSKTWSQEAHLSTARVSLTASVVREHIAVVGGLRPGPLDTVEIFDPVKGMWMSKARFPFRVAAAASAECNGLLFVSGGSTYNDRKLNVIHSYNMEEDSWSLAGEMLTARSNHAMATVNKKLYMAGGSLDFSYITEGAECFDPASRQTTAIASLPHAYRGTTNAVAHYDRFLMMAPDKGKMLIYHPTTNTWTMVDMQLPHPCIKTHLALFYVTC